MSQPDGGGWISLLPQLDTTFIVISGCMVLIGYVLIRLGRRRWHMWSMLTASTFAALFLLTYLLRSALVGPKMFAGHGGARIFYLGLLSVHTLIATILPIFVLIVLYNAWRGRFDQHKRFARYTVPMWLFVAVSGWAVYYLLYVARWSA